MPAPSSGKLSHGKDRKHDKAGWHPGNGQNRHGTHWARPTQAPSQLNSHTVRALATKGIIGGP
jgi:hypothetical protein